VTRLARLLTLAVLAVLAVCAAVARAGWWDDAGAARRTSLEEIRKDPDRWLDVTILLDVRVAKIVEPGNAYATRFNAKDWRAVAVYGPDATPESMGSTEPYTHVFVRADSLVEQRVAGIAKGRRAQFRGAVRDTVKGEPWLEVFEVVSDGDPLSPEESALLARGAELLAHDNAAGAEAALRDLARRRTLPKAAQADLWRKIGAACWEQKRFPEAAEAFAVSLAADPDDAPTVQKLSAARAAVAAMVKTASETANGSDGMPPVPSRSRRLLPPTGMSDRPTPPAPSETPAVEPPAVEPPAPAPADPAPAPGTLYAKSVARPERPSVEPPPPPAPAPTPAPAPEPPVEDPVAKPKLFGPK
jgi:hypothetical protein